MQYSLIKCYVSPYHDMRHTSGCIFAELLTHEAVFQGENPQNQLELIVGKLGCPPREKLDFVESSAALSQLLRYENRRPPPFQDLFPKNSNPEALGLCPTPCLHVCM